jgi:large subunit ribosomal protein L17
LNLFSFKVKDPSTLIPFQVNISQADWEVLALESLKELFGSVADKVATRPGGYTRIIKLGTRLGDNAEMCIIELVDFNQTLLDAKEDKGAKSTTRRSRRSKSKGTSAVSEANVVEEVVATESVYDAEQNLDEAAIENNYVNDPAEAEALAIAEVPEVEESVVEEVAVVEEPATEETTEEPAEDKPTASEEEETPKA